MMYKTCNAPWNAQDKETEPWKKGIKKPTILPFSCGPPSQSPLELRMTRDRWHEIAWNPLKSLCDTMGSFILWWKFSDWARVGVACCIYFWLFQDVCELCFNFLVFFILLWSRAERSSHNILHHLMLFWKFENTGAQDLKEPWQTGNAFWVMTSKFGFKFGPDHRCKCSSVDPACAELVTGLARAVVWTHRDTTHTCHRHMYMPTQSCKPFTRLTCKEIQF